MAYQDYSQGVRNSTQQMRNTADAIPDYNVWTILAKAGINGLSQYYDSRSQKLSLEGKSKFSMIEAQTAQMNAQFAKKQAELSARSSYEQMYNSYRMGEHQAMLQGLADAQQIHGSRAQQASSGVRMDVGSAAEIDTSNVAAAKINQAAIQETTINTANKFRIEAVNANVRGILEEANYMAQSLVLQGDAMASQIMADVIDPLADGLIAFGASVGGSYAGRGMRAGKY